jgi:hypothetical protein
MAESTAAQMAVPLDVSKAEQMVGSMADVRVA